MTTDLSQDDFVDLLYKYTDFSGAQETLTTCKLRFTRPSELNNPFDVRIDQWLPMELRSFYELIAPGLIERSLSRPDKYAESIGIGQQEAKAIVDDFQSKPEHERTAWINLLAKVSVSDFESFAQKLHRTTDEIRTIYAKSLNRYGIFCATRTVPQCSHVGSLRR